MSGSDAWQPPGVWDAFLIDALVGSGLDAETVMAMTAQERVDAARAAAEAGRLDAPMIEALQRTGLLPRTRSDDSSG